MKYFINTLTHKQNTDAVTKRKYYCVYQILKCLCTVKGNGSHVIETALL